MLVDDHAKTHGPSMAHHVVELAEPLRLQPVLGVHVLESLQVETNVIEAGLPDLGKVPPFEPALAGVCPIGIVSKHIDPAMERLTRLIEHSGRGFGRERWRWCKRGQYQRNERSELTYAHRRDPIFQPPSAQMIALSLISPSSLS